MKNLFKNYNSGVVFSKKNCIVYQTLKFIIKEIYNHA